MGHGITYWGRREVPTGVCWGKLEEESQFGTPRRRWADNNEIQLE